MPLIEEIKEVDIEVVRDPQPPSSPAVQQEESNTDTLDGSDGEPLDDDKKVLVEIVDNKGELDREHHVLRSEHRNGEACRASLTCFWLSLINLISKDTIMIFYLCIFEKLQDVKRVSHMKSKHSFV